MTTIKNIIKSFWAKIREGFFRKQIKKLNDDSYFVAEKVPIFAQWESKELVNDILNEKIKAGDDSKWQQSGAKSKEEYVMYSWQACGMACLKMILKAIYPQKDYQIVDLMKKAEKFGVYKRNNKTDIRYNLDGAFHGPLAKFVRTFDVIGSRKWGVRKYYLSHLILKNCFIIASVHSSIRDNSLHFDEKGGHLVLLKGFEVENNQITGFYINNPSGFHKESQENHFINLKHWQRCFSGNIIIVIKKR